MNRDGVTLTGALEILQYRKLCVEAHGIESFGKKPCAMHLRIDGLAVGRRKRLAEGQGAEIIQIEHGAEIERQCRPALRCDGASSLVYFLGAEATVHNPEVRNVQESSRVRPD